MSIKINYPKKIEPLTKSVGEISTEHQGRYFIGECGDGPKNSLYCVCHETVVLMEDLRRWTCVSSVTVDKWVDIEINVLNSDTD